MSNPATIDFKSQLDESLRGATMNLPTVQVARHECVYLCGDRADHVYFIQSGQIKLLMLSPQGKECLLAIHTAGDTFGELSLTGYGIRQETATAMYESVLKGIPCQLFFQHLLTHSLFESFVKDLASRINDQQRVIADLITGNSKHRLAQTLLALAHKLGQINSRNTRIEQKITHEELSEMVGTTRPRITKFMREFRARGLIEITPERFLVVKEKQLTEYLCQMA